MSRRAMVFLLMMAGLAGLRTSVEAAQEDSFYGQPVVSVTIDVEGRTDVPPAIAGLSDVRIGQPLRLQDVRTTTQRLDSLGRYEGISIFATAVPGGVAVTWRLVPRHPISRFTVRGDTGVSAATLEGHIRQRFGGVPTGARLSSVESTLVQFLNDEGYLDATATASTEVTHDPESATLVLTIAAGPLTLVTSAVVRGESPLQEADVIARSSTRVGQPFRRRAIEAALGGLEDDLRGQGYYEAQARLESTRVANGVDVLIVIDAGRRVEVRVVPAGALPGKLDDLVPLRRLGSADEDLLEDSRAAIERLLKAEGYWRASAPFARVVDDTTDRLIITFTVARGPRFYVDRIDLPAALSLPAATLRKLINVEPGQVFDEARFVRGLGAVIDEYRRNGYYLAKAEPAYEEIGAIEGATRATVVLHPNIVEGPRGQVSAVTFTLGENPAIPEDALKAAMASRPLAPYVQRDAALDRATLERLYQDRGFRRASVDLKPAFSEDGRAVTLAFNVEQGTQIRIGQISIVGNDSVSESEIRDALGLSVGDPAGVSAINAALTRVNNLGVFRRASLSSVDQFSEPETELVVNVVEAPDTTVAYGGGIEGGRFSRRVEGGGNDDLIEFAPRGSFEVTRRNIGGRNRIASFFSRVALKRSRDENSDGFGFTEYRASGTFRERNILRTRADLVLGLTSEQAVRTTFNFIRQSANLELYRPLTSQLSVSGRYNLEFTKLFDERFSTDEENPDENAPIIDRAFPQVRLSVLSLGGSWDRRDNPLTPTQGTFVSADLEGAFRKIGSQVGYLKGFFQASGLRRLDQTGQTVIAGRAELGIASGFARTTIDPEGLPIVVDDLPANKRFFAGGSSTVRGFQLDRLAVPEALNQISGLPLGGNGLVVLNAELRRYLTKLFGRNLGGVVFVDGGNVFRRANDIDLRLLRAAVGFGVRYNSPLGPLRLDFGFKAKPMTVGTTTERRWEYHFSIGEIF